MRAANPYWRGHHLSHSLLTPTPRQSSMTPSFTPPDELFNRTFESVVFKATLEDIHKSLEEHMTIGRASAQFTENECPLAAMYILRKAGYDVTHDWTSTPSRIIVSWYPKEPPQPNATV